MTDRIVVVLEALLVQQRIANRLQVALIDQLTIIAEGLTDRPASHVNVGIRTYLSAADWESIEVPEDDPVWGAA